MERDYDDWTSVRFKQPKIGTPEYLEYALKVYQPTGGRRGAIKSSSSKIHKPREYYKPQKPIAVKNPVGAPGAVDCGGHALKPCLCGGQQPNKPPKYAFRDSKIDANKVICETLVGMNLKHNGMISVLEEVTLNTVTQLLKNELLNKKDCVVNLINNDKKRCAEMSCKIAQRKDMNHLNVMLSSMWSTVFLQGNSTPHRLLWLDYTSGANYEVFVEDIKRVFSTDMFAQGGVLAVTLTKRNNPEEGKPREKMFHWKEGHKLIQQWSEGYKYKVKCVKTEGTPYLSELPKEESSAEGPRKEEGPETLNYRGVVLFVYEVRPAPLLDSDCDVEMTSSSFVSVGGVGEEVVEVVSEVEEVVSEIVSVGEEDDVRAVEL